jgi:hypothetical protein
MALRNRLADYMQQTKDGRAEEIRTFIKRS